MAEIESCSDSEGLDKTGLNSLHGLKGGATGELPLEGMGVVEGEEEDEEEEEEEEEEQLVAQTKVEVGAGGGLSCT